MTQEQETTEAEEAQVEEPSVAELMDKIGQLTKDIEEARTEAKSHQSFGQRTKAELDKQVGLDGKVTGIETRLQVLTEMVADIVDRDEGEEVEAPKKRRSEEYLSRIPNPVNLAAEARKVSEAKFLATAREADGLAKNAGYEMATSPEMERAYLLFRAGDADRGLEEVKKVLGTKTEADPEQYQKDVEEAGRKYAEGKGWLKSDNGAPSGKSASEEQIRAAFRENPTDPKARADYNALRAVKDW